MLPLCFYPKFFLFVYLAFVVFTVIGTLSHEGGHYLAARWFGYSPSIHYGPSKLSNEAREIYFRHQNAIYLKLDFSEKKRFDEIASKAKSRRFWLTLGGPLQTMLTGTIGLLLVLWRKTRKAYASSWLDWFMIFLSLFWLRQSANLFTWIFKISCGMPNVKIRMRGDELILAHVLKWPTSSILLVTGIIGMLVASYVIFNFVPKNKIFSFGLGGLLGGVTGYVLWLIILGPIVLP